MFANEDEGFQELYDRLLAYSSAKESIQMSENKTVRKDDPMDVDALSEGKPKRKGKKGSDWDSWDYGTSNGRYQDEWESWDYGPYKGRGKKGQNHVTCWNCGKTGHWWRNCSEWWRSRGKGKGRVQGDEHADEWTWKGYEQADGWTWGEVHVDGLWKTSDWQNWFRMVDDSRRLDTVGIRRNSGWN